MDKNSIKKFVIWARRELIAKVSQRATFYGITDTETIDANADNINNKVLTASEKKQRQALYKYLFVAQCNALNANLPYMFAKIEDYTELLLPDYLLREGSVIEQMISQIPEEDWTEGHPDTDIKSNWKYYLEEAEQEPEVEAEFVKIRAEYALS